jgi:pimeloyl-ACP methyl ester carboxylesterase
MTQDVVLAPGLWMPAIAMALFTMRLARCGFSPRVFAYPGRSALDENVERFARFVREAANGRAVHVVGHSLGGVLVLEALNRHADIQVRSALLLGAPVRGCLAGRRFGSRGVGRWMMGACCSLWEERRARWQREAPLGVIAGTSPVGLGRVLYRLPGDNDGVVCVDETTVDGMADRALLPLGHSMLITSGRVTALAGRFLATGRFA